VDPAKEDAFIDAWTQFVQWAATQPGSTTFRLGRDTREERRFVSFAAWTTFEAAMAWTQHPEFQEQLAKVVQHVDDFHSTQLQVVAAVETEYGRV
jgi:heme-degrading monooxygenase HmoA